MTGSAGRPGVSLTNCVALLDVDPGLGVHLSPEQFREARGACMLSVVGLPRGNLSSPVDATAGGYLVIRGVLTRRLVLEDRRGSELLGLLAAPRACAPPAIGAPFALAAHPPCDRGASADRASRAPRALAPRRPLGPPGGARRAAPHQPVPRRPRRSRLLDARERVALARRARATRRRLRADQRVLPALPGAGAPAGAARP